MSFIDEWMPARLLTGWVIGPRWKSTGVEMDNGMEHFNADWLLPKFEARGTLGALSASDRVLWRSFAMTLRGRKNAFRVMDPLDCVATNEPLIVIGGVTYLGRTYTTGSETAYRIIQAPKTATLSGAGSINMENGVVTGADPETDTWSGRFGMWMRLESDWTPTTAITPGVYEVPLELVERRRKATE